jgi:hypothetical protein
MFNNDCARCHQDMFRTAWRFSPLSAAERSTPDPACKRCHDMPAHNEQLLEEQHCAACHREHRGRISLARVPDDNCTNCHADLKSHDRGGDKSPFRDVTGFPAGHPEFALWTNRDAEVVDGKDPGRLHFNHQVHLQENGVLGPDRKPVHLDCAACHQYDESGRYMKPIQYEAHCARCHPLSVRLTGTFQGVAAEKAAAFNRVPAPHKAPAIVRAELRERLLEFARRNPTVLGPEGASDRALPQPDKPGDVSDRDWVWMLRQMTTAETLVFHNIQLPQATRVLFTLSGGCAYCHIEKKPAEGDALPEYEDTNLRRRWLSHARFDHQKHRTLSCADCHAAAESRRTSDVLLPKMETCAKCHNPSAGARHDCAECHGFHDRTKGPPQQHGMTIPELLGKK